MANIYDVARESGFSIATVSRVLNDPYKVATETKVRIQKAMEELEFRPSEGKVPSGGKFKRIGVLSTFSTAYSFVERQLGILQSLPAARYEMVVYNVENEEQLDNYLGLFLRSNRVDGIVLLSLPFSGWHTESYRRLEIPVVSIERDLSTIGISSVVVDNVKGGRLAAEYLTSLGCRRMAFIGDGGNPNYVYCAAALRLEGFSSYLEEAGIPLNPDHVHFHYLGLDHAYRVAGELIDRPNPPDAVFAASDFEAVALQKIARELGVRVPEDLAILGFDNVSLSRYLDITTIDQHLCESGRTSVEMLIHQMANPDSVSRRIELNLQVVERSTTKEKKKNPSLYG